MTGRVSSMGYPQTSCLRNKRFTQEVGVVETKGEIKWVSGYVCVGVSVWGCVSGCKCEWGCV